MLRSVVAVVCGFLITVILSLGADGVLMSFASGSFTKHGATENSSLLALTLGYTLLFAGVGGYAAAAVARRAELKHALALGMLGLVFSIMAVLQSAGTTPLWWRITLLVLIVPCVIFGGYLRMVQKSSVQQRTA